MKVISASVRRQKTRRVSRVAQHQIRIDHTIEYAARADPLIERLAFRFVLRRVEAGQARVAPPWVRSCSQDWSGRARALARRGAASR